MLIDRPQIVEGSFITNPVIPSGTADPTSPNVGELFFRTDLNLFRIYGNSAWASLADSAALTAHIADDSRHLTTAQNTFLDGITVTFTDVNSIPTLTANLASLTSSFNTHAADTSLHLSAAQNTFLDGLALPGLTAAHVNFLQGVTSNVQAQIDALSSGGGAAGANLAAHIADDSRHLTASQNTWIDAVTVTSTEVNQLAGVTGNIQTQLNAGSSAKVSKAGDTMTGALSMGANKVTSSAVPTTSTDLTNKKYVDDSDYLNNNPKAGLTSSDGVVPIYSDFKFALGVWGSVSFSLVDRESKQILYYHAQSPTRKIRVFRAYRFSDNDSWIFDNDPMSLTFLAVNEYVRYMGNAGTYFVFLSLASELDGSPTRYLLVKTNGSSKWQDWTMGYDVTSLLSTNRNFALVQDSGGDRILRLNYTIADETLDVYNSSLTLLRSQTLYVKSAEIDPVDHGSTPARTGQDISWGYNPFGLVAPFTWDPNTQTLHQKNSGYYTYNLNGVNTGQGYAMSISWTIPRSWIINGTGSLINLIPTKNGSYRYSAYSDSTWDTDTGGMSTGYGESGQASSLVTDEYSGNIFLTRHGTFTSVEAGTIYRLAYSNGKIYKTFGNTIGAFIQNGSGVVMPDGSAWSKSIAPNFGQIIGNQIQFQGTSSRYGTQLIDTTFSTSSFSSVARSNDTLKLDAAGAILAPDSAWPATVRTNINPGAFGTVVVAGAPINFWASPGSAIYTASASGSTRTWTTTAAVVPTVPTTIGAISSLTYCNQITWNGSLIAPIYWVLVRTSNAMYVAKCTNGTWSISSSVFQAALNQGNSNRGDTLYSAYTSVSVSLLTEQGRWIFDIDVPNTGGTVHYTVTHDTNTNTMVVDDWSKFNSPTAGTGGNEYTNAGGYGGSAFGFSTTLGYYAFRATSNYDSAYILSSKDVRGVGSNYTEDQWYNNTNRYEVFITTESATGLVAYLSEYPIFLGGYYVKVPTVSVTLQPSATNYVYATKDPADRTTVNVTTSTQQLPTSFTRMLIASITTNTTQILSMQTFVHDGIGLPDKLGNSGKVLKTDGTTLFWADGTDSVMPSSTTGFVQGGAYVVTANTAISASQPGYRFSIFNNSGASISLTASGGITLRQAGTTNTGTRTLLPYGLVSLWFLDGTTCILDGNIT